MRRILQLAILSALAVTISSAAPAAKIKNKASHQIAENADGGTAVLWQNPVDISSRNLFYGPGGKEHEPHGTFTFVEEDLDGTNPKIVVRDQDGVKWTVKLGGEARPETAASRLTWAVGYFANEDYFLPDLRVANMPPHLHRGQKLIAPDGSLHDVRLKRHLEHEKKAGTWSWGENRFQGTRELNGLRVMMALINNWDLTDENNAVYAGAQVRESEGTDNIYMTSDLGSTFGLGRLTWPMRKARGNLQTYSHSKFISKIRPEDVDFRVPTRPAFFFLATPREFFSKLQLRWIGKHVPRADAKWMGELLAQLSADQIRDAFRAAGYSPEEVEGFTRVVQDRTAELEDL
jgi:hypothetical protein